MVHIYAWINWHQKAAKLGFYNHEFDNLLEVPSPKRTSRPRQSKYESPEQFKVRLADWEAKQPPKLQVQAKGNHMTGQYYTDRLLAGYCDAVIMIKQEHGKGLLQEDGDPSHGMKNPKSVAARYRASRGIEVLNTLRGALI